MSKRGQIAIFVIIAVVIIGLIVSFFAFRGSFGTNIPGELQPVFSYYTDCISQQTKAAVNLAGLQGGRIDTQDYAPGNNLNPFSSHLNFLGNYIPYWYTFSSSNVIKKNAPSQNEMESDISEYIAENLNNECDFSSFYQQGFSIQTSQPSVDVSVRDNEVKTAVSATLKVSKGDLSATQRSYSVNIGSKLGSFFNLAQDVYSKELEEAFLEGYATDVLRFYAPVDGVEVQCSPKIWKTQDVVSDLLNGIDANFEQLKFKGNYYTLKDQKEKYFEVNLPTDYPMRVLTSSSWPSRVEITPADQNFMIAEPIGNQEGLGALGFCYVPYHFVYDLSFPALFQIYSGDEIFQFPVVVIVDKNQPRNALSDVIADTGQDTDICSFKTSSATISTYDSSLKPINANVSYQCFEQTCSLGESSEGMLHANLPSCVNGYLVVESDGYATKKQLFSSNSEGAAEVLLEKLNNVDVEVLVDGNAFSGSATVHFESENGSGSVSALLPGASTVRLQEGLYNISVYVYGNSSIVIPGSTRKECTKVASSGLFGFFGGTEDRCFDITVPETKVDYALSGGGSTSAYLFNSELASGKIKLYVPSLPQPKSLQDLQSNFEVLAGSPVDYSFA